MTWAPRAVPASPHWVAAKWIVLVAAVFLSVLLLWAPRIATRVFWYGIIPLLPALFLINAELWRNVCPIATLSTLRESDLAVRPLTRSRARWWTGGGILLFLVLVPFRPVLFDESGPATAMLLGAAAAGALLGGVLLDRKAGFCNSICPILPVERLYGQRPLARVQNARCAPCRACTHHACFDLNPERSGLVSMGTPARGRGWVITPFGAFALALPGFVAAFYLAPDLASWVPLPDGPPGVYAAVFSGAAVSWLVLSSAVTVFAVRPAQALLWAAGLAVTTYYWFTPAAVARAWALDASWIFILRFLTLSLVGLWVLRALSRGSEPSLSPVRLEP